MKECAASYECQGVSCRCNSSYKVGALTSPSRKRTKTKRSAGPVTVRKLDGTVEEPPPVPRNSPITSASFVPPTFEPLATTIAQAAELLDKPVAEIEAAAAQVEPYTHHDGTPRWSLRELRTILGLPVKKRKRRSKGGDW